MGLAMNERWRSSHDFVQLIGGRWTLAILEQLAEDGCRYQELHDRVEGIAHKVLTETLRGAERDGLITRRRAHRDGHAV